jgi:hypothetical protein
MSTQTAIEFFASKNIPAYPIILDISESGKTEFGEPKYDKELVPVKTELYGRKKTTDKGETYTSFKPEQNDWDDFPVENISARMKLLENPFWKKKFNYFAMPTNIYKHIDLDCPEYSEVYKDLLKTFPYFKSATKSFGKHIIVTSDFKAPKRRNELKNEGCPKDAKGQSGVEFLDGQWSYVPIDAVFYNADCPDLNFDFRNLLTKTEEKKMKPVKKEEDGETDEEEQDENVKVASSSSATQKHRDLFNLINLEEKDLTKIQDQRTTWQRLCDCMKRYKFSEQDWFDFYTRNNLNDDKEKQGLFSKVKGATDIYFAQKIAKKTNPDGYKIWQMTYKTNMPYETYQKGTNDVSKFVSKFLITELIYCNDDWWTFNKKTKLWNNIKDPTAIVVNSVQKSLDESININEYLISCTPETEDFKEKYMMLVAMRKTWGIAYARVADSSFSNQCIRFLKSYLCDNDFTKKLDANIGKLAFKNGVMDLETKTFRNGLQYDDFLTQTIPYDYKPSETSFIKSVLKKILNNNDEHLEYFLSLIGFTFIGDPELEKSVYFMIDKTEGGKGDNGKTLFFDILNTLLPNYVYRSNGSLISKKNQKVHKQLIHTKGKRLVWLEELPKEDELNSELLKEIGDGKSLEFEVLFKATETINVYYKMFCLSNHCPNISPDEKATFNRYKQVSYNSHFDRTGSRKEENAEHLLFIADNSLSKKIKEKHYDEVFNLIIDYAHLYYTRKLPPIPEQFIKDTEETKKNNDEFGIFFNKFLKPSSAKRIADKILIEKSGMLPKDVRDGMKRQGFVYNKELKGLGKDFDGKALRGGYQGIDFKTTLELQLEYPDEDFSDSNFEVEEQPPIIPF